MKTLLMCLTKSDLSGGLYKIANWIGLDLDKKMSTKILSVLLQKVSLQLYAIKINKN